MIKRELIISNNDLQKLTQKDIINYAKHLHWKFHYEQDNGTLILNSPNHDGVDDLSQIIIPKESASDAIDCYWDCILHLSHYHNISYIEMYEKIIGLKYHPDHGQRIGAICSWGEGPHDVMITANYYGVTKYYDLSQASAEKLGRQLLQSAKCADELYKMYEDDRKRRQNE